VAGPGERAWTFAQMGRLCAQLGTPVREEDEHLLALPQ
jgi:hypothetical protein